MAANMWKSITFFDITKVSPYPKKTISSTLPREVSLCSLVQKKHEEWSLSSLIWLAMNRHDEYSGYGR